MKIVEAAGMLLFARTSPPKFLLMRHSDRWDLPKGHAEVGEEMLATALRETEEETGLAATLIEVDPTFKFVLEYPVTYRKRGDCLKRVTYYIGYLSAICPITVTEHDSYKWFTWPTSESLQPQTVDALLQAAREHFATHAKRLS